MAASVLLSVSQQTDDFFQMTFKQVQELDTETHKAEDDLLLPHTGEDHKTPATVEEVEFVKFVSKWINIFIFPALVDTIVGVEAWKRTKRSDANVRDHFKKQKSHNL